MLTSSMPVHLFTVARIAIVLCSLSFTWPSSLMSLRLLANFSNSSVSDFQQLHELVQSFHYKWNKLVNMMASIFFCALAFLVLLEVLLELALNAPSTVTTPA